MITVTDAIKYAREYANDFYQGEDIKNLGLEEVVFDDEASECKVGY